RFREWFPQRVRKFFLPPHWRSQPVRRQDFWFPPFDPWLFPRNRCGLAREKSDWAASVSRVARPEGSRVPRGRGSGRQDLLRVQALARLAELPEFCGRSERHSKQTATRRHVSSAPPEWGPPLAGPLGYRTRFAAGILVNPEGQHRASEFAGKERSVRQVAGAANPECGSAFRQSWFR